MRTNTKLQLSSLFMIVLMLLLPVAFAQNMTNLTAGNETAVAAEELSLEVVAPLFSKDKYITIEGTTVPNARLEYYIGPTKIKVSRAKSDGTFITSRIPMIKKGDNDLLVKATIEDKAAQKSFTVNYDPVPPDLNVSAIPEFTTKTSLNVHGDVSEPVLIKYTSYPKKDSDAPPKITSLEMREIKKNQVTMVWTPSDALDLLEYAIYRDGKRIGVARSAIFVDNAAASGKEYTYRVSAVDTSCNEGVKSAPKKAVTPPGGSAEETAVVVPLSCAPVYKTLDTFVPFDITLPLQAGGNVVEIIASDKAGNTARIEKLVTVDTGPPQFVMTNLDNIGTTYIPEVTIRGNLSEKGSVFVYVNDEKNPSHFGVTDDSGGFEILVKLKSDVKVQAGQAAELDTGVGWQNKIKLKAVDLAGQEAWYPGQQQSKDVIWAICGYGSWLDFDVEEITPATMTPRLLMQGIQQIGIPFTLKYIGGQDDAQIAGVVNAVPVRISPDLEDSFDNEKISNSQVWIKPRPGIKGVWDGYVQINFVKWPVDQLELEGNVTSAAIEAAISDWRRGEFHEAGWAGRGAYLRPGCLNPAMGCVKLYLEIDIPLKEKSRIYDPNTQQERFEWKTVRQRNCLPIILDIDQVIPPDVIRKDALKGTSNFLGSAIDLIDEILDPLYTFTENMVYLCMGAAATLFIMSLAKRVACSPILEKVGMAEKFDPVIAETGLCRMAYGGEAEQKKDEDKAKAKELKLKKSDKYRSCRSCEDMTQKYRDLIQDVYQPICDRISCPSAPTVQKFIIDKRGSVKKITKNIENLKIGDNPDTARQNWIMERWGVKGDVFSGNSCGFKDLISTSYTVSKKTPEPEKPVASASTPTGSVVTEDILNSFATGSAIAGQEVYGPPAEIPQSDGDEVYVPPLPSGYSHPTTMICGIKIGEGPLKGTDGKIGIKEIYEVYKGDYTVTIDGKSVNLKELCSDPSFHPACPLCCGIEYMWEWNSACGVGNFLGSTTGGLDIDTYDELKHSTKLAAEKVGRGDDVGGDGFLGIFNSLSGFCTPEGNPTPDVISTHLNFKPGIEEAESNLMQVFVFPDTTKGGDEFKYRIYRGYLAKSFVIENAISKGKKFDVYSFSSTLKAVKEKELTRHFGNLGTKAEAADKKKFVSALCTKLGESKFTGSKKCTTVAPGIFEQVKGHVGTVEQEYIIRPDSSIINSVRCICLSAIIAFLEQWRQIAQAIKNCIDMIILTGDGEEGMCRSMLSNYVCDLLWEIITCFTNKWSKPSGARKSRDVGIGDVLGLVTGAGTDVSNNVKGRYGETAMFNAMFNEKEIVHGLCYLAFGLEWNLDVSAMVKQSIESVPVETMVLGPAPAQARFIAWNPVTNPRGLTTWEYHFGLMISAGADINARVKFKCSTGFGCSETDGFAGGECDCNKLGTEKVISINPTCTPAWNGRLSKNELASYDCSYTMQAGKYRFDTILFEYDWQDPGTKEHRTEKSEAAINRVGSAPPIFCRFDTFSLSFRCKFGEDPSGIRIEKIEPQYEYSTKDNKEVFAMDKNLDFELSIKQMMPEIAEEMNAGVKFLGYKILNSANKVVKELDSTAGEFDQVHQLKTDGAYKKDVKISSTPESDSWEPFFGKGGESGSRYKVTPWSDSLVVTNKIKADVSKYIDGISIKATKNDASALPTKKFVVDIKDNSINLYEAKERQSRGSFATSADNAIGERKQVTAGKRYTYKYTDSVKKVDHEITFRLKSKSFDPASDIQFLITYLPGQAVGDPCTSKSPVIWKVTFTSYDADKYGRVTSQKSVDPTTGETQEKTIPIHIVCENAKDLKAKGAEPAPGAGILEPPFWFSASGAVINLVTDVTLPPGEGRLYVETFGKGNVDVEVTEKDASAMIYHMDTLSLTDLPPEIQDTKTVIEAIKEKGEAFVKTLTFEQGKEYTVKIKFMQSDGKIIETKTYTGVKVGEVQPEAPEMKEAFKLRGEGKFTEAFNKFTKAAQKYAGTEIGIRAEFEAGITKFMADENSQALSIFNIFITENPSHAKTDDALSTMATIYFALGKPKEGLKAYQKIIKDYPKGDMVDIAQMQLTIRCEQYKKECQELGITPLPPEKLPLPYELQEKCDVITQFFTEVGSYPILAESYREAFGDMATLKSICGIPADVDIKFECDVTKSCDDYYTEKECKADVCKLACYYSDKTCKKIDCDKITECKDYASYGEIPCREDVCKEGIECAWRVSPKPETCIPIAKEGEDCMIDILVCGDYKTEEACNADKCKYGCSWKDATCKKTTAPAVRVKYKDGKFIDPIESADNKFYVMPGLPGVYIFFKFDPAPKTLDEAKALCSRLKMTVSQGVFVPGSFKIIALPNISQFEMGHCRTNPPAVPTHFRSFFKKKRVDIDIKLLDAPGGSKAISSKLIQLYPTVNRSNIFLLNDGSRSKDYQFQFIKGEWRWCVANTKTLYPMDDWVEGKSSIWWDIIFEEMQEDKKSYVEGMLTLKMAANDKGPGWIFGPSIVIRKLDWPPGASGVIYKDVDDFTEFLIDGYITK